MAVRPALRNGIVVMAIVAIGIVLVLLQRSPTEVQTARIDVAAPGTPIAPGRATVPHAEPDGGRRLATPAAPIEVCGYGKTLDPEAADFWKQVRSISERTAAIDAAVVELGASGEPGNRAVALYFQAVLSFVRAEDAAIASSRGCERNETCRRAAGEAAGQASAPYQQQLIDLATQTTDPMVYSLAYTTCMRKWGARPAGCASLTARRWAEIDPHNGAAWLFVAGEAAARNDDAARVEAMTRAAAAERFDQYGSALLRPTATRAVHDAQPLEKIGAFTQTLGVYAAWPESSYSEAAAYCEAGTPQMLDARRPLCDALATRLVERDATTMGLTFGRRIGERLGWSPGRLAAIRDERDALAWAEARDAPAFHEIYSCGALEKLISRSARTLKYGERGALQREVVNSGRTPADLAHMLREDRARQEARTRAPMPE